MRIWMSDMLHQLVDDYRRRPLPLENDKLKHIGHKDQRPKTKQRKPRRILWKHSYETFATESEV